MGKRTTHPPGTFSWVDLATTDPSGAKTFYTGLFGWETQDNDAGDGDGGVYITASVEGDAVCGLFEMPDEMRGMGVPPNWTSYVTVDDADATAARVTELGGEVVRDAFDVMDLGRMAVLKDPQGAVFAIWQPGSRIGAERVNDVGCLCINELATSDMEAAGSFYADLFGWTMEMVDTGPGGPPIMAAYNGGTLNANLSAVEGGAPPHWRPYFTVESVASALERIGELGGKTLAGPIPIPEGGIAIALDPQGAVFALFEGRVDP
jgi:uncharacterized protein